MPEYLQHNPSSTPVPGIIIRKWYSVDPSEVEGIPNVLQVARDVFRALTKFHIVENDAVREMMQPEKDALLAAEAAQADTSMRTSAKAPYTQLSSIGLTIRAFADIIKDEINILRAEHGLAPRTLAQLKTAIQNRIDSGDVD